MCKWVIFNFLKLGFHLQPSRSVLYECFAIITVRVWPAVCRLCAGTCDWLPLSGSERRRGHSGLRSRHEMWNHQRSAGRHHRDSPYLCGGAFLWPTASSCITDMSCSWSEYNMLFPSSVSRYSPPWRSLRAPAETSLRPAAEVKPCSFNRLSRLV